MKRVYCLYRVSTKKQVDKNDRNESEYRSLVDLIDRRYDKELERYESGEKDWKFRIKTTVVISGTK